jgi:hypothetical protein
VSKIPEWAEQAAFEAQTAAIRECQDSKLFVIAEYPFVTGSAKEVLDKHIALALVAAEKRGEAKHAELKRLLAKAEDGAGTLKAKDSVKLRPADWHSIAAAIRQLGEPKS